MADRTTQFGEFQELIRLIQESEGERIHGEIREVQSSLRLVRRNYEELVGTIGALQQEQAVLDLHNILKKDVLNEALEVVATRLHNFLGSAFGLVDHMRRHRSHLYSNHEFNREIQSHLTEQILNKPQHILARGLRDYCLHVGVLPIGSRVVIRGGHFKESGFFLHSESLLRWDGWTLEARRILLGMPDGMVILDFIATYFKQVEGFYVWLWGRQSEIHKRELDKTNALKDSARSIYKELAPGDPRV